MHTKSTLHVLPDTFDTLAQISHEWTSIKRPWTLQNFPPEIASITHEPPALCLLAGDIVDEVFVKSIMHVVDMFVVPACNIVFLGGGQGIKVLFQIKCKFIKLCLPYSSHVIHCSWLGGRCMLNKPSMVYRDIKRTRRIALGSLVSCMEFERTPCPMHMNTVNTTCSSVKYQQMS